MGYWFLRKRKKPPKTKKLFWIHPPCMQASILLLLKVIYLPLPEYY
jgi:hypothetical protein